jgi:small subunit ribosomal protein S21
VTEVRIREHESIDEALRRFKRECERAGLMTEIKRREYYESPSVRKKRKIAEAKRKQKRKELKFLSRLKRKR